MIRGDITQPLRAIPVQKRAGKIIKTAFGGAVFVGGFFLPKYLGFPWQAGAVVSAFGAFAMSQELVTAFLKTLGNVVKMARSGKNGASGG